MKIVLLGGSGRLGSAIRRLWSHHEVVSPSQNTFDHFDPEAIEAFLRASSPDVVINCAAYNAVDAAEGNGRRTAFRVNAEMPRIFAGVVRNIGLPFIHFSSDYVFHGEAIVPYAEDAATDPINEYGASKLAGEQAVLREYPKAYVIRLSRLYGSIADEVGSKPSFVEIIIGDASKAARVLVNGGESSAPTYVDDVVRHLDAQFLSKRPEPGIYHMSNEGGATWHEWASEIGRILDLPVEFVPRDPLSLKRPAERPAYSILTSTKIPKMRPWKEALYAYLASSTPTFKPLWHALGIYGTAVELQPRIGDETGAVLHILPGGTRNSSGFGYDLQDIYATTACGRGIFRGGHYHPILNELFVPMSGVGLWILSDFRDNSPTYGTTVGVILGIDALVDDRGIPSFTFETLQKLPRLRIPAGVYHTYVPLTDIRTTFLGIGSASYDKEDYCYPEINNVPGAREILSRFGFGM